jgi:hypothetical protein
LPLGSASRMTDSTILASTAPLPSTGRTTEGAAAFLGGVAAFGGAARRRPRRQPRTRYARRIAREGTHHPPRQRPT